MTATKLRFGGRHGRIYCNAELRANGFDVAIDHRSYERQGVEKVPTVHMGVAAMQMERRGIRTERGNHNRKIDGLNRQLRQLRARIRKLEKLVNDEYAAQPILSEVFSAIQNQPKPRTQKQRIADAQFAARTLVFIQENNIETLVDMKAVVQKLRVRQNNLHMEATQSSRRYQTLAEHIQNAEAYSANQAVFMKWQSLKGDKEAAYYDKHTAEIQSFTAAHNYLTRQLNGRNHIPLADWKREFSDLSARRAVLLADSEKLSTELRSAETIMRNAEKVIAVEQQKRKPEMEM